MMAKRLILDAGIVFLLCITVTSSQPSDDEEMIRLAKSRKVHAFFYLWYIAFFSMRRVRLCKLAISKTVNLQ
jgi:hypothetical protein